VEAEVPARGDPALAANEPFPPSTVAPSTPAAEDREGADEKKDADPGLDGFEDLPVAPVSREEWIRQLEETDYGLEALRLQGELLASDCTDKVYRKRRSRLLEAFAAKKWKDPARFGSELDAITGRLDHREPSEGLGLIGDVLSRQESQETVDSYFLPRMRSGTPVSSLRPLFYRVAMRDSTRPAQILTSLWKASRREDRDVFLDEVFSLEPQADTLATWGIQFPRAFSAPRSLARLGELPMETLRLVLLQILSQKDRPRSEALDPELVVLRAAARKGQSEQLFTLALRKGGSRVKAEVLALLDRCSTREMFLFLHDLLDTQN
jgi:hypothetical protein